PLPCRQNTTPAGALEGIANAHPTEARTWELRNEPDSTRTRGGVVPSGPVCWGGAGDPPPGQSSITPAAANATAAPPPISNSRRLSTTRVSPTPTPSPSFWLRNQNGNTAPAGSGEAIDVARVGVVEG